MFVTADYIHRRERSKVPYIVRQCIEEVEKRGIDEVGIYRISGVATDIQALKANFDTSKTPHAVSHSLPPIILTGEQLALNGQMCIYIYIKTSQQPNPIYESL